MRKCMIFLSSDMVQTLDNTSMRVSDVMTYMLYSSLITGKNLGSSERKLEPILRYSPNRVLLPMAMLVQGRRLGMSGSPLADDADRRQLMRP